MDLYLQQLQQYHGWCETSYQYDYRGIHDKYGMPKEFESCHSWVLKCGDLINSERTLQLTEYQNMITRTFMPYAIMYIYHEHYAERESYICNMYQYDRKEVEKKYIKSISLRQNGKSTIATLISGAMFCCVPLTSGYYFDQGWVSFNQEVSKRALTLIKSRLRSMPWFQKHFKLDRTNDGKDEQKLWRMKRFDDPLNSRRQIEVFCSGQVR